MFHSFPLLCAKLNCPKGKKLSKWALTYVELLSCMPEIRLKKTINLSSSWGRARAAQWALGARWWQLSALESVKLTRVKIGEHGRVQHSDSGLLASCRYDYCSFIIGNIGNIYLFINIYLINNRMLQILQIYHKVYANDNYI